VDRDPAGRAAQGVPLYHEIFLPVGSPETAARVADPGASKVDEGLARYLPVGTLGDSERMWRHSVQGSLEGFPLLDIKPRPDAPDTPGWRDWLDAYPHERTSPERGVQYALVRNALEGVKSGAGLLVCGLSCVIDAIDQGNVSLPFLARENLRAKHPYRMKMRDATRVRPQLARFADWLAAEAAGTKATMDSLTAK